MPSGRGRSAAYPSATTPISSPAPEASSSGCSSSSFAANGLPHPEVNVRVGRFLVDFLWRDQRLIVETDGERYHRGQLAKAEDLLRDHRLREMGFEVLR